MSSASAVLLVTVAAVIAISYGYRLHAADCPELCVGQDCNPDPEECGVLGEEVICGRRVCYKGPGDECGKPYNMHGLCAPSLHCEQGRCKGCVLVNNAKNCSLWDHHFTERTINRLNRYRNF